MRTPGQEDPRSVHDLVREKVADNAPLLAWAEPDPLHVDLYNETGLRPGFVPLVCGVPSWPDDLRFIEARLFWASSMVHVIAREGGGCVWTRIEEGSDGGDPDLTRSEIEVHTLRDLKRFGFPAFQPIEGLRAIEYRQQGRLVAWRLVLREV
jgi:hypothetical protein